MAEVILIYSSFMAAVKSTRQKNKIKMGVWDWPFNHQRKYRS